MHTKRTDTPFFTDPLDSHNYKKLLKAFSMWAVDRLYERNPTTPDPNNPVFEDTEIVDFIQNQPVSERMKLKLCLEATYILSQFIKAREMNCLPKEIFIREVLLGIQRQGQS